MMAITVDRKGEIAHVTIDNPPVNAASRAVRAGLMKAIAQTQADPSIKAVILRAAGRTFTVGADVRELSAPPMAPHLPDVVLALETVTKPWIAALHGTTLGGGLEIALGCTYRIAHIKTKLGFPEVTLGLIPGAGGTVRLPRLIPASDAVTMIAGGKPIPASQAKALGLIDDITNGDLDDCATALAHRAIHCALPAPLTARDVVPAASPDAWHSAKAAITAKTKGTNAPQAAIQAVQNALDMSAIAALAAERAAFVQLKQDPQSAALRHIFFAERAAGRLPQIKDLRAGNMAVIGVIGGGTMGAGIAACCLLAGLQVVLIERDDTALAAGQARVLATLASSLQRGLISAAAHDTMTQALRTAIDYNALSDADIIIEAVFEDMDIKRQVFAQLEQHAKPSAILASNTSYLDVNIIAAGTQTPDRVIGLHFFSPAHIMKLLEIVITDKAMPQVLATAFAFGKRLGKISVPAGVCDGFIGNRIMSAYRRGAEQMVEDGALPWDIDTAMRDFGFPMGVFKMQDLAGLDISWAMRKRQADIGDTTQRSVDLGDKLCEAGRFGRKTQVGWYDYVNGKAVPSAWTENLITAERMRKHITPQTITADHIIATLLQAMQSEANALLAQGIATSAADIDVVMVNGYRFPRWRGGPMYLQSVNARPPKVAHDDRG